MSEPVLRQVPPRGATSSFAFCIGDCNRSPQKNERRHRMGEYRTTARDGPTRRRPDHAASLHSLRTVNKPHIATRCALHLCCQSLSTLAAVSTSCGQILENKLPSFAPPTTEHFAPPLPPPHPQTEKAAASSSTETRALLPIARCGPKATRAVTPLDTRAQERDAHS